MQITFKHLIRDGNIAKNEAKLMHLYLWAYFDGCEEDSKSGEYFDKRNAKHFLNAKRKMALN